MPDYEKMYHMLFNKITDVIEELQKAQKEAEEMYIADKERKIQLKVVNQNGHTSVAEKDNK